MEIRITHSTQKIGKNSLACIGLTYWPSEANIARKANQGRPILQGRPFTFLRPIKTKYSLQNLANNFWGQILQPMFGFNFSSFQPIMALNFTVLMACPVILAFPENLGLIKKIWLAFPVARWPSLLQGRPKQASEFSPCLVTLTLKQDDIFCIDILDKGSM